MLWDMCALFEFRVLIYCMNLMRAVFLPVCKSVEEVLMKFVILDAAESQTMNLMLVHVSPVEVLITVLQVAEVQLY
jgi:hypothetical protein